MTLGVWPVEKAPSFSVGKVLFGILALAFTLRLGLFISAWLITGDFSVFYSGDSMSYLRPAKELIESGTFSSSGRLGLFRTPGYPLMLVPGVWIGHPELVAISLQILLSCATVWLVFLIARRISGSERSALLCAFLYSIEPVSVVYSTQLLSETLFTFLLVLFLYGLGRYLNSRSTVFLILSALSLTASAYVRPIGFFLPIPIAVFLLVCLVLRSSGKIKGLVHISLFILICFLGTGLWQWRNWQVTGYSGFANVAVYSLYYYQAGPVVAKKEGISFYRYLKEEGWFKSEVYYSRHPEQRKWPLSKRMKYMTREGLKTLMANPGIFIPIFASGMVRVLLDPEAVSFLKIYGLYPKEGGLLGLAVDKGIVAAMGFLLKERPLLVAALVGFGFILLQYYLAGAALILRRDLIRAEILLLVLVMGYFLVLSSGGGALGRFRHPIMPGLAILAGLGYPILFHHLRYWRRARKKNTDDDTPRNE